MNSLLCALTLFIVNVFSQIQEEYDVIIMGAGASGIAAAKTLYEAGITNILIIEAQDYIGGRAKVSNFSNYSMNIGASWISGICLDSNCSSDHNETNPMFAAAEKYNISYSISEWENGIFLDFGGEEHNETETENTDNAFWDAVECVDELMENASISNPEDIEDMSYSAALRLCGWPAPRSSIQKTVQWINFDFNANHARYTTAFEDEEFVNTYSAYGPSDVFITDSRGYQGIIGGLAREFLDVDHVEDEDKIMLNAPITTIEYDQGIVFNDFFVKNKNMSGDIEQHLTMFLFASHCHPESIRFGVHSFISQCLDHRSYFLAFVCIYYDAQITEISLKNTKNPKDGVSVTLEDESVLTAKYGVVTFSLGVLQSDLVSFIPSLPSWKMDALLAFNFVDYTPILVKWPYDFWSDKIGENEYIILNEDRFGFFPWIYNLDVVLDGSLIWRFDVSLDLAQTVQYQPINDTIKMMVDLKLKHYFDDVPEPEEVLVAGWNANKYVQGQFSVDIHVHIHSFYVFTGSYSDWPPYFDRESKEAMGWPLSQRLFFAGEAFSDFDYGYVHSAWLSGIETAEQILSCLEDDDSSNECPAEYVPPDDDADSVQSEDTLNDLIWLWIALSFVLGMLIHYLFWRYCARYCCKRMNIIPPRIQDEQTTTSINAGDCD